MSQVHELHLELQAPNLKKFKHPFMTPPANSYLLEEVLKEITSIVNNANHEQVEEYEIALTNFNKIKCWICFSLTLTMLVGVGWSAYIFLLCEQLQPSEHCNYMDYSSNTINQSCWSVFIVLFLFTLTLIIVASYRFTAQSNVIRNQWITAIQNELRENLAARRQKSPQHTFEIRYTSSLRSRSHSVTATITIRKHAGNTHSAQNTPIPEDDEQDESEVRVVVQGMAKKPKHIQVSAAAVSEYAQLETPVTDVSAENATLQLTHFKSNSKSKSKSKRRNQHQPQVSTEVLQQMQVENSTLMNMLVTGSQRNMDVNGQGNQMQPMRPQMNEEHSISHPVNVNYHAAYQQSMDMNGYAPHHGVQGSASNLNAPVPLGHNNMNMNVHGYQSSLRNLPQQGSQSNFMQNMAAPMRAPQIVQNESSQFEHVNQYDYGAGDYSQRHFDDEDSF